MIEVNFARLRTHQNNIQRYRQLLETGLTDLERQFIEKRLSEERLALETLAASTFPSPAQSTHGTSLFLESLADRGTKPWGDGFTSLRSVNEHPRNEHPRT